MSSTPREQGEADDAVTTLAKALYSAYADGVINGGGGRVRDWDTLGDHRLGWITDARRELARLRTPSGETDAGGEPIGWVVVMWDDQGFPGSDEGLYGPDERSDAEEWAKTLNGLDNGYTYTVHPVGSTVREDGEIRTALAFAASVIKGGEPWTGRRFASL